MTGQTKKCAALVVKCQNCQRLFRRDERYILCPDCGTTRECPNYAVRGQVNCNKHGGAPNLKNKYEPRQGRTIVTGKQSTSLVANLASKYIEMGKNGPLVSNTKVLTILDDRLVQLLDRIAENYSDQRIKKITGAWEDLKTSVPGLRMWVKEQPTAQKAFGTLDSEVNKAYHDYESWNQVKEFMNLRAKVAKDQMSILKDARAMITAEDAYELSAQLLAAVVKVLGDDPNGAKLIKSIHGEFARILGEPYVEPVGPGEPEIIDIDTSAMDREELSYPGDEG